MPKVLDAALAYAAQGWVVVPCIGKSPSLTPHGLHDGSRDPATVRELFQRPCNIAVVCGAISNNIVLDIDVKNGGVGFRSLQALEDEYGELPPTLTCTTWSGGEHRHFTLPEGIVIPSRTGFRPNLDIRSEGGVAVIPPSVFEGKPYVWKDVEGLQVASLRVPLPLAYVTRLTAPKPSEGKFTVPLDAQGMIPIGQHDDTMFRLACSLTAQGFTPDDVRACLRHTRDTKLAQDPKHRYTERDLDRWMDSAAKYDQGKGAAKLAEAQIRKAQDRANKAVAHVAQAKEKAARIAVLAGQGMLYSAKEGRLVSCQANVEALLKQTYPTEFWLNTFSMGEYFRDALITDATLMTLHQELEVAHRIVFQRSHVDQGVKVLCAAQPKHPLRDWLDGLVWDGVPRLDRVAKDCLRATNDFAGILLRKWMISAVARVYQPGCKVDYMLLLIGKQGIRKSTAMEVLASAPYFLDHEMGASLNAKDTLQGFVGHWICEFSELSGMQRWQIEQIKAFITRKVDVYRPPYGRRTASVPRSCVFCGTTNDETPLKQEDENRRFWPIYCADDEDMDLATLRADRAQLWAESKHYYQLGEPIYIDDRLLDSEIKAQQRKLSDRSDPWEEELGDLLEERWTATRTLFTRLEVPMERRDKRAELRLVAIMKRHDFVSAQTQIGGGMFRGLRPWIKREWLGTQPWYGETERVEGHENA